jgi:hypothetical protein
MTRQQARLDARPAICSPIFRSGRNVCLGSGAPFRECCSRVRISTERTSSRQIDCLRGRCREPQLMDPPRGCARTPSLLGCRLCHVSLSRYRFDGRLCMHEAGNPRHRNAQVTLVALRGFDLTPTRKSKTVGGCAPPQPPLPNSRTKPPHHGRFRFFAPRRRARPCARSRHSFVTL